MMIAKQLPLLSCSLLLLLLALSIQYGSCLRRNKRRITAGDTHLTVSEIRKVCCRKHLDDCCRGRSSNLTIEMKKSQLVAESKLCGNPWITKPYIATSDECNCTISAEEKKQARTTYCDNLPQINKKVHYEILPMLRYCISRAGKIPEPSNPDPESYKSFQTFVPQIEEWQQNFLTNYKVRDNCGCTVKIEPISDTPPTPPAMDRPQCIIEIMKTFDEFIAIMDYVDFIASIGRQPKNNRRKGKCLRGCVGNKVMNCGAPLIEYAIPSLATHSPAPTDQVTTEATTEPPTRKIGSYLPSSS